MMRGQGVHKKRRESRGKEREYYEVVDGDGGGGSQQHQQEQAIMPCDYDRSERGGWPGRERDEGRVAGSDHSLSLELAWRDAK